MQQVTVFFWAGPAMVPCTTNSEFWLMTRSFDSGCVIIPCGSTTRLKPARADPTLTLKSPITSKVPRLQQHNRHLLPIEQNLINVFRHGGGGETLTTVENSALCLNHRLISSVYHWRKRCCWPLEREYLLPRLQRLRSVHRDAYLIICRCSHSHWSSPLPGVLPPREPPLISANASATATTDRWRCHHDGFTHSRNPLKPFASGSPWANQAQRLPTSRRLFATDKAIPFYRDDTYSSDAGGPFGFVPNPSWIPLH